MTPTCISAPFLFEGIDQIDLTVPVCVIDVLTYPAVQLLDVAGPIQVFASANDLVAGAGGARPYVLRVLAQGGEGVTASAGVALAAGPLTKLDEALDTLLVAGGDDRSEASRLAIGASAALPTEADFAIADGLFGPSW
jgi:transcriptional regulator GlxA family with amidase domain